jgi:hypothetical protein
MSLAEFGKGWQITFEPILQHLQELYPSFRLATKARRSGMLALTAEQTLDKSSQFVVDSVMYKIERASAVICEHCGNKGTRKKHNPYLPEVLCLCWPCEVAESNRVVEKTTNL